MGATAGAAAVGGAAGGPSVGCDGRLVAAKAAIACVTSAIQPFSAASCSKKARTSFTFECLIVFAMRRILRWRSSAFFSSVIVEESLQNEDLVDLLSCRRMRSRLRRCEPSLEMVSTFDCWLFGVSRISDLIFDCRKSFL